MVAIIDYGMGNVASVQKALNHLSIESYITNDFKKIESSNYIVLPGVGSFLQAMNNLKINGLDQFLTAQVIEKKKPFLGICLGMQLIAERSFEPSENIGLGWVKGDVIKITDTERKIPHMGWNNLKVYNSSYFENLPSEDFYFIHSYHFVPKNNNVIAATVDYGKEYVACVQQDNIFATQFHPEKSQVAGLKLLQNFFINAKG